MSKQTRQAANVLDDGFDNVLTHNARVFRAGNSLAIRIPIAIAKHMEVEDGTVVELTMESGISSVRKAASRTLAGLIERITPDNVHRPIFEDPIGAERW